MSKWEYMYVRAEQDQVWKVNGQGVGKFQGLFKGYTGRPSVSEFLEKAGQESWEVVGICPASESANFWRLILKRSIS